MAFLHIYLPYIHRVLVKSNVCIHGKSIYMKEKRIREIALWGSIIKTFCITFKDLKMQQKFRAMVLSGSTFAFTLQLLIVCVGVYMCRCVLAVS